MGRAPVTAESGCPNEETRIQHQTSHRLSEQPDVVQEIQGLDENDPEIGPPLDWATVLV